MRKQLNYFSMPGTAFPPNIKWLVCTRIGSSAGTLEDAFMQYRIAGPDSFCEGEYRVDLFGAIGILVMEALQRRRYNG